MIRASRTVAVVVLVAALASCSRTAELARPVTEGGPAVAFANGLQKQVSVDVMFTHLTKLQDIATANGGTRAVGTPG